MKRLEDYIFYYSLKQKEQIAIIFGNEQITYEQLYSLVKERSSVLSKRDESYVLVRVTQSLDFLITYFAAHLANKAIVPLEKDIPEIRFEEIASIIKASVIPDDIADILFTTGTTGVQKGVMLKHSAIIANAENLIEAQGFTNNLSFIISGPLNHIGSLSKVWPMILVGGTIIITEGIKDINSFFAAIDLSIHKIATFLVPASLRILMQFGKNLLEKYSSKIEFIETGAAPMSESDMELLCNLLPNSRLYNTYASTETGIISTYDYCSNGCIAGCLGEPMKHASVIITNEGTIACKGPMLMTGYVGDELSTNKILIDDVLYTSDLGYIDDYGRLCLEGRKDDIINVGGYKISPVEVENIVLRFPDVVDCICVCDNNPIIGNVLKLIYVPKEKHSFEQKLLIKFLKANLESYKIPSLYEISDKIQRTFNGKIDRKFYRKL